MKVQGTVVASAQLKRGGSTQGICPHGAAPHRDLGALRDWCDQPCLMATDPGTRCRAQILPAGWDSEGSAWQEVGVILQSKLSSCDANRQPAKAFCPSEGHREQCEHGGGRAREEPSSQPAKTALRKAEGNLLASPAQQPSFQLACHRGSWAPQGSICCSGPTAPPRHVPCSQQGRRAGSSSRAGKFLCIQSFYSIKISGSYSATSPLYCLGGLLGYGQTSPPLQTSHPLLLAKGLSQPAGSTREENPSPGSWARAPRGCSVPGPLPCPRSAAGADSFEELFIDTETSMFFPVDKTFSCGPLKK